MKSGGGELLKRVPAKRPPKQAKDAGLHRVCFDFDGTLVEDNWPFPGIGKTIQAGVDLLIAFSEEGYEVCIYTARPESHRKKIEQWLNSVGLQYVVYDIILDKPAAWLYIDDRAWNPWLEAEDERRGPATEKG